MRSGICGEGNMTLFHRWKLRYMKTDRHNQSVQAACAYQLSGLDYPIDFDVTILPT